ncbi:hypothetical protein ACOSQ3_032369 [Xanthoceras sorbifolium]
MLSQESHDPTPGLKWASQSSANHGPDSMGRANPINTSNLNLLITSAKQLVSLALLNANSPTLITLQSVQSTRERIR